jgi:hypothetical protein
MRTIVFFRVYGIPILLALHLVIRILNNASTFNIFGSAVFLFSITMIAFLTDKRYLQKISIGSNRIHIAYMNNFLQSKTIEYDLEKIDDVKLTKRKKIAAIWPPELDIKDDGEWKNFLILSKEQYHEIQSMVSNDFRLLPRESQS